MGFRPEDIIGAGRLTTDPASPLTVQQATPVTLTPPVTNPKAVRLYSYYSEVYVETAPVGESLAEPTAGSLTVPQGVAEYVPLEPGGSVRIGVSRSASPNPEASEVQITWLS